MILIFGVEMNEWENGCSSFGFHRIFMEEKRWAAV